MRQPTKIFSGEIKGGKILLADTVSWLKQLSQLEGQDIEITICKRRRVRSLSQNNYYWGVVIPLLAEYAGNSDEEMHEVLKWEFLRFHGEKFVTVKSTKSLDTGQFTEYIEQCRRLAAEHGVVIPDPHEVIAA